MSDDDELQKAIALSLSESLASSNREPIVIDSDDEESQCDRDLRAAIEASKAAASASASNSVSEHPTRLSTPTPAPVTPAPTGIPPISSFISERAALEAARLERQKRRRDQEDPGKEPVVAPTKRQRLSPSSSSDDETLQASNSTASTSTSSTSNESLFWQGAIRQIGNAHVDPRKDTKPTFRLSEIISPKAEISFAIVSSYCEHLSWLYEFFDPQTPVILVGQPDAEGKQSIKNVLPNWVRVTPFLRGGRGCMHIKLLLLFYKNGRLRVVIPTANMVTYDWKDIENSVWLQDIPLRSVPEKPDPKANDFPAILQRVLKSIQVLPALKSHLKGDHPNLPLQSIDDLRTRWDWSAVKVALVPSIAGKHEGWSEVNRTGHTRLANAIREIGARAGSSRQVEVEYQGSSIGTYSTQWMNEFYCSAQGESARTWLNDKGKRSKLPYPPMKVIFPSLDTVQRTVLGITGGTTLFCRKSQWEGQKFPRELFHDSRSKRGSVLMHTKMMIAMFKDKPDDALMGSKESKEASGSKASKANDGVDNNIVGWGYVGSHNFSPSAWGTLSGSALTPVLNITNFELGIVFPLRTSKEANDIACWERPPRKYDLKHDVPWMQDDVLAKAMAPLRGG